MTKDDLIKKLIALAQDWDKRAWEQVPEDYSSRNLHYKFLKLDNEAAGLSTCADELKELVDSARASDGSPHVKFARTFKAEGLQNPRR